MQLFYFHQPDEIAQAPVLHVEDSQWTNLVAPVPLLFRFPHLWQFEQHESPTLQTALVFDEWENPTAPRFVYPVPQVFTFDDVFVAPQPALATDEDLWKCLPAPVAFYPSPRVFAADDEIQIVPPIEDEDFWSNPVTPVFAYPARVFLDDDVWEIVPPIREELYWQNPVFQVAASNWLQLPYLPDPEEIPAGFLVVASGPDVLGVGSIAESSGVGIVAVSMGSGQVALTQGSGRIN
jgi:hypothetical protein